MIKNISISQYASGSRTDRIGDTTLFYTEHYSRHASEVSGIFLDNPPVLSPKHASLVWRYYQDADVHSLIHVQGSHVVNAALGRIYPYRAAYEVSRADMNAIDYRIGSLLAAMPRIGAMPSNRVSADTAVDVRPSAATVQSDILSGHIKKAIVTGPPLYISTAIPGTAWRCDGIYDSDELKVLVSAIESLPLSLRRYASFGFAVDDHYSYVLDDVLVIVHGTDSKTTIPAGATSMTWQQATTQPARLTAQDESLLRGIELPGSTSRLLPLKDLGRAAVVSKKPIGELRVDDWQLWQLLGHTLGDLGTSSWDQLGQYLRHMDDATRATYISQIRQAALGWPIDGLTRDLYAAMGYDESALGVMQRKALKDHLQQGKYGFLYEQGIPDEVKQVLDKDFLRSVGIQDAESAKQWYKIYKQQGMHNDPETEALFGKLFAKYVTPSLADLDDIVSHMRRYPFVAASTYVKPRRIYKPDGMDKLSKKNRARIEGWLQEEIAAHNFGDISQVSSTLRQVAHDPRKGKEISAQSLLGTDAGTLYGLITSSGKSGEIIDNCESLLAPALSLPKDWDSFVADRLLKAIRQALFGSKSSPSTIFGKDTVTDVSTWPRLCGYRMTHPNVYLLIEDEIRDQAASGPKKAMAKQIRETYIKPAGSGKKGSVTYSSKAASAQPLISTFITTIKKHDKNMAKDLDKLFKDLKGAKNYKKRAMRNLLYGLAGGIVLSLTAGVVFHLLLMPKSPRQSGATLTWHDNGQNLISQIADLGSLGELSEVSIDTMTVRDVKLDKTANLVPIAMQYYGDPARPEPDPATAIVYSTVRQGDGTDKASTDTISVSSDNPLIKSVSDKKLLISSVTVRDSITIDIPNKDIIGNDTTGLSTMDAKYYFGVIKYLRGKLPADVDIAY